MWSLNVKERYRKIYSYVLDLGKQEILWVTCGKVGSLSLNLKILAQFMGQSGLKKMVKGVSTEKTTETAFNNN